MTATDTAAPEVETTDAEQPDHQQPTDTEEGNANDAEDQGGDEPDADGETFTRTYVEKLRRENQRYRERAGEADGLAQRLHTALVAATGKLADPSDLSFDAAHLDETNGADALVAAIDELIERKPHLRSRRPAGDIGQGATRTSETVDLAGLLRART